MIDIDREQVCVSVHVFVCVSERIKNQENVFVCQTVMVCICMCVCVHKYMYQKEMERESEIKRVCVYISWYVCLYVSM